MKRRFSRWLVIVAAATMGSLLEFSCSSGDAPPEGDHCWFFCKAIERAPTPTLIDTPLPWSQMASENPA
jgi:hypothetical protein